MDLIPGAIQIPIEILNPDQKDNPNKQITEWLEPGVIKPSTSPWATLLVPVKKKDGRMRWVTVKRPEGVEQAKGEGQLPRYEYPGDPAQSSTGNSIFFLKCLWSLSCHKN